MLRILRAACGRPLALRYASVYIMRNILISIALLSFSNQLCAWCPKYPNVTVAEEIKGADFIVTGKVISRKIIVNPIEDPEGYDAELFQVQVEQTLYGKPPNYVLKEYLSLYNVNDSGRFPMVVGEKYLMFVSTGSDGFYIDSCGNSGTLTESKEIIKVIQKIIGGKHA
jgi:hypothetical protein